MADPSPTPPDRGHEMLGLCFDLHLALKPPSLLNSSEDEDEDEDSENRTTFLPSYRPRSKFTIAVRYYVKVGKFFGEPGWLFTYRFTENENASLHTPCSDKAADEVRQKALMKSASLALGTRRCQIMRSGDWECAGCNKLAVTLRMFFISSDGDEDLKHTPSIFCDAVPICSRRPKNPCQDVAIAMIHKKIAVDFSTNLAAIRNRYCENCGHGKDIFFCTECGSVSYCSRKCQRAGWPEHKRFCKIKPNEKPKDFTEPDPVDDVVAQLTADKALIYRRFQTLVREKCAYAVLIHSIIPNAYRPDNLTENPSDNHTEENGDSVTEDGSEEIIDVDSDATLC